MILTILFFTLLVTSIVYWSIKNGISPMPTSPKVKARMLEIPLKLNQGTIYELGAGWGTLAFAFAKKYPAHQVKAYETSWIPYAFCCVRNFIYPQSNLQIYRVDFFNIPLQDAALVICYLYRGAMKKLKLKFDAELDAGAIVLSNTFKFLDKTPNYTFEVADLYRTKIYVYYWENPKLTKKN